MKVTMNHISTCRCFEMKTTKKSTYPAYPVDVNSDVVLRDNNGQVLFRSHEFDRASKYKCNKKWHKNKLTYGDAPLSGLQPYDIYIIKLMRAKYLLLYVWELQKTMSKDIWKTNINMTLLSNFFKKATKKKYCP